MSDNRGTAIAERQESNVVTVKPAEAVRAALEKLKPQIARALPRHITPDRLLRVAMTAIQNTPKLLECDRTSLFSAIMTCAQLGLEPDGVLGQAYLVPFAGKVQFIPGYKGLIMLARNSGDVTSIEAHEVCERDQFDFAFGLNARCEHVPARGARGEIVYFYAIARFKDGGHHWDVMTRHEVETIRDRSSGWQAAVATAKYGKEIKSPWHSDFAEMGKKTCIRRIAKYLPLSVQKAAAINDAYDRGRHGTLDSEGEIVIEADQRPADVGNQIEHKETKLDRFEAETGEIIETETGSGDVPEASRRDVDDATAGDGAAAPTALQAQEQRQPADAPSEKDKASWMTWGTEQTLAVINVRKVERLDALAEKIGKHIEDYAWALGPQKAKDLTDAIAARRVELAEVKP